MTKKESHLVAHSLIELVEKRGLFQRPAIEETLQDLRISILHLLLDRESLQRELKAFSGRNNG